MIGRRVPRADARRLVAGRGRYVDDIELPRMVHLAFVRSPHAHARIDAIDTRNAAAMPGVIRVVTGADVAEICASWQGTADHLPGLRSPPQLPLAVDRAAWQGEPVAAIAALTRAEAEDAAEAVIVDWTPLPAVADLGAAFDGDAPVAHPEYNDNLALEQHFRAGDVETAFAGAATVVERSFAFGRHTGVTLEPRGIISDFDPSTRSLTVYAAHQAPWQQQDVFSRLFGLEEHNVRIITPDIGGAFGLKLQVYGDEVAAVAVSILIRRPVKFVADRLEAFISDAHAREVLVTSRMGVSAEGRVMGMSLDVVGTVGAYSSHRRIGIADGVMTARFAGAPYDIEDFDARLRIAFQNKPPSGVYRGVGQPIACAVTEQLMDLAAEASGLDAVEIRRRNYVPTEGFPRSTPGGAPMTPLSLHACLDRLVEIMDYDALRADQSRRRAAGIHHGVGIATIVEFTAVGPGTYGPAGARVTTQDGCTVRLEPSGKVRCVTSVTDQGQGTWTGIAQIVADRLGVEVDDVRVVAGDTAVTPYGGGAWASRGLTIGGEAAWKAGQALRENILALAGTILQTDPERLTLAGGAVRDIDENGIDDGDGGQARISLAELGEICHFRQDTLPPGTQPELAATRHYVPDGAPNTVANGMVGASVVVDSDTGFVSIEGLWMVDDCGRVVNPLLVDEQMRGGLIQGIGGALLEHCLYDGEGQLLNGTLADYLVPMSAEMPDIVVAHVETPVPETALGAKGVGEAGTVGAPGALLLAVNDALAPLGAHVNHLPITPEGVLNALAAARS